MNDNHMTSKEAADYIGISLNTLRKYVHQEELPVLRFPGRRKWTFRKDLVDGWIEARSQPKNLTKENKSNSKYGKLRVLQPYQ